MIRLFLAASAAAIIIVFAAFWFLPGGALAMGCAGQLVHVSWYGAETCHGRPPGHGKGKCETAAGIAFDGSQWLVANKSLPFGTKLRLTYRGRSAVVPVLDRGPFIAGRTLDLSRAVAAYLGTLPAGVVTLCMERIQ